MQKCWEAPSSAEGATAKDSKFHGREMLQVVAAPTGCKASNEYSGLAAVTGHDKKSEYGLMKELCMNLRGKREREKRNCQLLFLRQLDKIRIYTHF